MSLEPPVVGDWVDIPADNHMGAGVYSGHIPLGTEAVLAAMAGYYGMINHVDDQLHNLIMRVAYENEPTYVIFLSDHGEMLGDHGMFRKSLPYQGSVRVPLMIQGPDLPDRLVIDQPVTLEDILPTCLDLADLEIPSHVEGRSLLQLIGSPERDDWRTWVHSEQPATSTRSGWHMLTDGRAKYIWWSGDGREQFFDLEDDPREIRDLALVETKRQQVTAWRRWLTDHLTARPEGFVAAGALTPGRPHQALLP